METVRHTQKLNHPIEVRLALCEERSMRGCQFTIVLFVFFGGL